MKSPTSQRSQALRPILQGARRVALLTGTPALAKASELYALLQSLLPGLLPESHNKFCARYCASGHGFESECECEAMRRRSGWVEGK